MRILSNTLVAVFFLFLAGIVIHGVTHIDGKGNHEKVVLSR